MPAYIPKFSQAAWYSALESFPEQIHPGLALFRFFEKTSTDPKTKTAFKRLQNISPNGSPLLLQRQEDQLKTLKTLGFECRRWEQVAVSRLVCGLGLPAQDENGFFLDRVFGLPYLSGSSLKGIAQDQALSEVDALTDTNRRREVKRLAPFIVSIFGPQTAEQGEKSDKYWAARKGLTFFLDAFPVLSATEKPFEIDIVNPHYGDYYNDSGKTPPADYLSPNLTLFLVLKDRITFRFALAARPADYKFRDMSGQIQNVQKSADVLADKSQVWLQTALQDLGIGGKTRVGYGYFGGPLQKPIPD